MNEVRRWRGIWRLGSPSAQAVHGTLSMEPGQALRLDLDGQFVGHQASYRDEGQRIYGLLDLERKVVLERCFCTGTSLFSTVPRQTWIVNEALFNLDIEPEEALQFRGAEYEVTGLSTWAQDLQEQESSSPLLLRDDVRGRTTLTRRKNSELVGEAEWLVRTPRVLRIVGNRELEGEELHDLAVRPLVTLLALTTGKAPEVSARRAIFSSAGNNEELGEPSEWMVVPVSGNLRPNKELFAFRLQQLAQCEGGTQHAFVTLENLQVVADLYLGALRGQGHAEGTFLLVAQALEVLHRSRGERRPVPAELWETVEVQLDAVLDEAARSPVLTSQPERCAVKGLKQKFDYFNEIGYRARVRELVSELGEHGNTIAAHHQRTFVGQVVDTRNYYVHWGEGAKEGAAAGTDLMRLTSRALAVLELHLLMAIGLGDNARIAEAVLRRRISWL